MLSILKQMCTSVRISEIASAQNSNSNSDPHVKLLKTRIRRTSKGNAANATYHLYRSQPSSDGYHDKNEKKHQSDDAKKP